MILRWPLGKAIVECLGQKVDRFLSFTNEGSGFVFGYLVNRQIFNVDVFPNNQSLAYNVTSEVNDYKAVPSVVVFSALSVIYFFSFIVNILFYYGIIQWATARIGWMLRITIGTTAVESISAASNIFLGQAMAPLLIKVYFRTKHLY
jgi:pyrimidine nucleoside transport protein